MKKIWLLTKIMISTSGLFNIEAKNKKGKKTSKEKKIVSTILLILLCFGSVGISFGFAAFSVTVVLQSVNLQTAVINLGIPASYIAITIISIFPVISVFFLSNDNATLLPLPLKPSELIAARFLVTVFDAYIMVFMFMAPLLIGYGIATSMGLSFYVMSLINMLILPLAPLGILLLISVLAFQKINTSKFKDFFTYLFVGIIIIIAFSFSTLMSTTMSIAETDPEKIIETIKPLLDGVLTKIIPFFPSAYFATKGLLAEGIGSQILFTFISVVISLAIAIITILLSSPIYLRTIKGSNEGNTKKHKVSEEKTYKKLNQTGQFRALVQNEWKLLIRNPTYVMNLIVPAFIFPIVFSVSFIMGFSRGNDGADLSMFVDQIRSSNFTPSTPLGFMVFLGIIVFISSMVMISSTAISRMGKSANFIKFIPVSITKVVNSKVFIGVLFSFFASLLMVIFIAAIGITTILESIALMLVSIPVFLLLNYLAIHIDAKKPHLDWINETQATKQNFNSVIFMFGTWGIAFVIAGIGFSFFMIRIQNLGYVVGALIAIITTIIDISYNRHLKKHAADYFNKIS